MKEFSQYPALDEAIARAEKAEKELAELRAQAEKDDRGIQEMQQNLAGLAKRAMDATQESDLMAKMLVKLAIEKGELKDHLAAAEQLLEGRAGKLLKKGKPFLVVANDEPYYLHVYGLIKIHEMELGRWTDEDEQAYQQALSRRP